jgi:hypothetical protein
VTTKEGEEKGEGEGEGKEEEEREFADRGKFMVAIAAALYTAFAVLLLLILHKNLLIQQTKPARTLVLRSGCPPRCGREAYSKGRRAVGVQPGRRERAARRPGTALAQHAALGLRGYPVRDAGGAVWSCFFVDDPSSEVPHAVRSG